MKHVKLLAALVFGTFLLAACGTNQQASLDGLDNGVSRLTADAWPSDSGVVPVIVSSGPGGNAVCSSAFPYATARTNFAGENPFQIDLFEVDADGKITDVFVGTVEVTVTSPDGYDVIAWEVVDGDIAIGQVIVKGSNASHVYTYNPASKGDSGLVAPVNNSTNPAGLSNITFCGTDDDDDRTIDEICEYIGETAWAAGTRYVARGNWATYTAYSADSTVTLFAGQHHAVGTVSFSAVDSGQVTITIVLAGARLAPDYDEDGNQLDTYGEVVKIQAYDVAPKGNPSPGLFTTYKGAELTVTVPARAFYGIHLDVERVICD